MKDRVLACNIQRQEYQEPPAPGSPPAGPILTEGPPMQIWQSAYSFPEFSPVHVHQHSIPRPNRQINRRTSRQITIKHNPIGSICQNASQRANPRCATTTSTVSSDSDKSIFSPVNQVTQAVLGNYAEMDTREFHPIDDSQPTTSRGFGNPPARLGTPDATWGDCTMCFESPIEPRGCNGCHQIIGCKSCVENWYGIAQHPSCPLCRRQWFRKPDVSPMTVIDSRHRTLARRRNQRYLCSLTVVAE